MDFTLTERETYFRDRVKAFIDTKIRPRDGDYRKEAYSGERWKVNRVLEEVKAEAKAAGLWNFFMPPHSGQTHVDDSFEFQGTQLSNLEYALCAEEMGRVGWASEVFNCSAPDTGNMEVFHRYGTRAHKDQWLKPLMEGEIRSAFLMTEPAVASSDATNIETRIERDGDDYVINGRKWWSSGVGDPRCAVAILMGKTDLEAARHAQQSMILVPLDAPGVKIERMLTVYGYDHAPHGHGEVLLENVRVPASNILLGEGRGFEIAQGRLGPGRIHHCMRTIGTAEEAIEAMAKRLLSRVAFGKRIADHSIWEQRIARARIDIEMTRLLCLKAADMMDKAGNKAAQLEIAMIKVQAPNMALQILDDAIQAHGGGGVSGDFDLAHNWASMRTLRFADGPDEVHNRAIARNEFGKWGEYKADRVSSGDVGQAAEMKAAVLREPKTPLSIEEVQLSDPGPREVLIRTAAAGVCRSDLHFADGAWPHPMPTVLGHEAAGVVEAVGSAVINVKPGDHVITFFTVFCGTCEFCVSGRPSLCVDPSTRRGKDEASRLALPNGTAVNQFINLSAFAEYMLVHENACVAIDKAMPLDRAALLGCAVITGAGAIFHDSKVQPGESVAVIGAGGIGLSAINAAKIAGAGMIVAIDPVPEKRELAMKMGATHTIDASADDVAKQVLKLTNGGAHYAIEAVGRSNTAELAWNILRRGGTATILGMIAPGNTVNLPGHTFLSGKKIQGSSLGSTRFPIDMPRLVKMYLDGLLDLDTMVAERIGLEDVNDALEKLRKGDTARSVILFP